MKGNRIVIGAAVLGVMVLLVGGMVLSSGRERLKGPTESTDEQAAAMAVKITVDEATKTALDNFPGKVVDVALDEKHDKAVWNVEILTAEQGVMVVEIDAESGSVLMTGESKDKKKLKNAEEKS